MKKRLAAIAGGDGDPHVVMVELQELASHHPYSYEMLGTFLFFGVCGCGFCFHKC